MERTLYIHLGPAKTGTSAIQSFLNMNEGALSKNGYHYLKTFKYGVMHHPLAWMLLNKHTRNYYNLAGKKFFDKFESSQFELKDELSAIYNKSIIISSEFLQFLNKDAIDELLSLFPDMPVKVIFYIRNISSQLISYASQIIKWRDTMSEVGISNLYIHINSFFKSFIRSINLWNNRIGRESIIFRKYGAEYFKNGSIYEDFLNAVNMDFTNDFRIPEKIQNQSLKYNETIFFKDLVNRLGLGIPQSVLVEHLLGWEKENKGTKFFLPRDTLNKIDKDVLYMHKYLLDNYLDESFVELFNKIAYVSEDRDYTLSYSDFLKILEYMEFNIDGIKNEFHKCMIRVLDRTYEYELKLREVEDELKDLIKEENAVALWGCGDFADKLFQKHNFLKDSKFYVVDKNIKKQGSVFWGHSVLPPEAIEYKGSKTVIISTSAYEDDIFNEIKGKYKNVKKIIKISGLNIQLGIECYDC